jgi:ABC-type oligopeptide transport system ATPase subunit
MRELIHDPLFPERNIIIEQFTEFTFKMHEAKINFLDHSPGNTLIINKGKGIYDFFLIDLNRMKFEELSLEKRMDNFKKMWLSKQMIKVVAQKYASLSNQSEEKIHAILLEKSTQFKRKTAKKKYLKKRIGK